MNKIPKNMPHEIWMRLEDRGLEATWENVLYACESGLDIMNEQFYEDHEIKPFTRMFKKWASRARKELAKK